MVSNLGASQKAVSSVGWLGHLSYLCGMVSYLVPGSDFRNRASPPCISSAKSVERVAILSMTPLCKIIAFCVVLHHPSTVCLQIWHIRWLASWEHPPEVCYFFNGGSVLPLSCREDSLFACKICQIVETRPLELALPSERHGPMAWTLKITLRSEATSRSCTTS
jgi:hypothetical protein